RPAAWRVHANPRYTGRGLTAAFLDSGFDPHPDLTRPANRIKGYVDATGAEPVEKASFKRPHVSSWHGLMTTGVALGNGYMSGDGRPYRGVASHAHAVLVKTGNQRGRRIHEKDIGRALRWVLAHHERYAIRVVNISLGGDQPPSGPLGEVDELVEQAVARGIVVVAAAGNGGAPRIVSPASAPSAITVGGLDDQNSLDRRHHRMYHSNYGRGVGDTPKPELIAPAIWLPAPMLPHTWVHNEALFLWRLATAPPEELARSLQSDYAQDRFKQSTLRRPLAEIRGVIHARMIEQKYIHPHYQHVDGTSFAAPIVSSVVLQMLEANSSLSPAQVKALLVATADPIASAPFEQQGHGVVNAAKAVAAALRAPGGTLAGLPLSPAVAPWGVTFTYHDERAHEVALVGSFNGWRPGGYELRQRLPGIWQVTIAPPPRGRHTYKFLVDGARWYDDPENAERSADGYGGFHSLLTL
ncbi:MAG: S8 family serine peptidase, partial [Chloroflexi bacterium]|nr:S8 family serine peptidase [Chloroflexota bacterium]